MIPFDFDVVIVGGGIAGSACATLLARRGFQVVLIEQSRFERSRIGEVCSGQLVDDFQRILGFDFSKRASGVGSLESGIAFQTSWGTLSSSTESQSERLTSSSSESGLGAGTYIRLDRCWLDKSLFEHAGRSGATTFVATRVKHVEPQLGGWGFYLHGMGETAFKTARLVIEATGRTGYSPFPTMRGRIFHDASTACALRLKGRPDARQSKQVYLETDASGWWYSSQLPSGDRLIVYVTDLDLLPSRAAARTEWLGDRLQTTQWMAPLASEYQLSKEPGRWSLHDARMSVRRQCTGPGWIALGDAQMALDPLSGQGIREALQSAQWATPLILQALSDNSLPIDHSHFARAVAVRYNRHRIHSLYNYSLEQRWSSHPFWQRRQATGPVPSAMAETALRSNSLPEESPYFKS